MEPSLHGHQSSAGMTVTQFPAVACSIGRRYCSARDGTRWRPRSATTESGSTIGGRSIVACKRGFRRIAREYILRALLLQVIYSVRSERLLVEQIEWWARCIPVF
jgi:hypothetical protein